ncbi:MAG: FMN-dependent NADH-azoreductase [Allosphingosinicella sp.]|uniref:FMN-dependent NADH-azoreductase n=1 Tax=Allosphingosinicella sp. TaxID=2823234 RepID=UPI00394D13E2
MKALIITSSALGDSSVSNRLAGELIDRLRAQDPSLETIVRDLGSDPVPHLLPETVSAIRGTPEGEAGREALALSDTLVAEIQAADVIVIGSPMYNFGIASTLKAWFDHVLRAGVTFRYTEAGPEGLVKGKKAVVIETRAGFYSEGPAAAMDGQEPHLRILLGFMGIDDVTFVRAEKLAFGPEAASQAIDDAARQLAGLAERELALAA